MTGVAIPNKVKIAIYTDAPACPTDVYKTAPSNKQRLITKSTVSICILRHPFNF
jgi:hypothetical protein